MYTLGIFILVLAILTIAQIYVGLKYLKILKSVENMVKECSHPIFTQDINRRETLAAIEKKVDRILEEMMKGKDTDASVKNISSTPKTNK